MTDTMQHDLLRTSLQAAVPLWIMEVRPWTWERRLEEAKRCSDVVGAHGDDLLFGGRHCADAFNALARGAAIMAYAPGGVTVFGDHYEVPGSSAPPGRLTDEFRCHLERLGIST